LSKNKLEDLSMRVIFICPRFSYYYARTPYIPLGIAYLASSIADIADDIVCIDGQILSDDDYEKRILDIRGDDIVCISATLLQLKEAGRITDLIKTRSPKTKILVGGYGPHSLSVQELFGVAGFDVFVIGEGERTLRSLIQCLTGGGCLENIPGIVFRTRGDIVASKKTASPLSDIDSILPPNRDLFDVQRYLERWRESTGTTSVHIIASRGCPFRCLFCDKSVTGRSYRIREPRLIVDEMEEVWHRYKPDDLFLFDDLFTLSKDRVIEVCTEILKRNLRFNWSAQGRVGTVDSQTLSFMKEAGCSELLFGVESGSDKILSFLEKGFARDEVIHTFEACHKAGLPAGAYLIVGIPGERKEDIDLTIDLVRTIRPSLLNFSFLTPFPNTELHRITSQWIEKDWYDWDDFTTTPYNYPFEVDPQTSKLQILEAYKQLIKDGMPHSTYQLLE